MNISSVISRVQRQFGDESGVQVSEADIIRWINDAQQEACLQHTFLLMASSGDIPTVANQQYYTLPSDLIDIKDVRYKTPGATSSYPLPYYNHKEMNEYIGNWSGNDYIGEPLIYTEGLAIGQIRVLPVPDHSLGIISAWYGRYPTDVTTAADTIDLPQYYHQYVVEFCLMKAYEMDEEWEAVDRKAAYVQSTLDANFARDEHFGKDAYPSIVATSGDYV